MVEETYEALDLLLFSTDQQTLRDFSSHIGLDTAQTDNLNKRKLLKEIRDFVGASLDQNTEAENVKNLNEWLGFFKRGDDHEDQSEDGSDDLQNGSGRGGTGSEIDDILRTGIVDQEPGTSGFIPGKPVDRETGNGHRNLEMEDPRSRKQQEDVNERIVQIRQKFELLLDNQLQEIQDVLHGAEGGPSQRDIIGNSKAKLSKEQRWTPTNQPHVSPGMGKRWTPNVNPEVGKTWTPIEQSNVNSLFRREFKIYGQINEQGKGDQLSFVSLSRQIEGAIEKGYTDKEVVEAVIKAMKPGMQLRSYVETVRDLTLPRLRQILISHYKEKSGTQLYQELATIFQRQKETPEAFLLRCLDLRQKILFASQEADAYLRYDPILVQGMFLRSLETGLRDDNILAKLRPLLHKESISDEELIQQMSAISSAEAERQARIGKKNNSIQVKSVSAEEAESKDTPQGKSYSATRGAEANILATVEAMQVKIKALQEEISEAKKSTSKSTNQQEEIPRQDNRYRWTKGQQSETRGASRACKNCVENGKESSCRHCNYCMGENHFARDCLKRQADQRQGQGNGKGLRRWDKA